MTSQRTFRRHVKKERERLLELLRNASSPREKINKPSTSLQTLQVEISGSGGNASSPRETINKPSTSLQTPQVIISQEPKQDSPRTLRQNLQKWYDEYKPSVECCNSLLKILKSEGMDVPLSVGDLMEQSEISVAKTVTSELVTTTQNNDFNDDLELVTTTPCKGFSDLMKAMELIQQKIDVLIENFELLKTEIKERNLLVADLLKEIEKNSLAMKNSLKTNELKYTKCFPIKTLEEFRILEENINETNEKEYIATIRAIVGARGLKKTLSEIILPEVLLNFNVDGVQNKMRLLNYKKFIKILFEGTYEEKSNEKSFIDDLRNAIRLVKSRHFKTVRANKKASAPEDKSSAPEDKTSAPEDKTSGAEDFWKFMF